MRKKLGRQPVDSLLLELSTSLSLLGFLGTAQPTPQQTPAEHPTQQASTAAAEPGASTQMHCASLLPPPLFPGGNVASYKKGETLTCAGSVPRSPVPEPARSQPCWCCRLLPQVTRGPAGGKALSLVRASAITYKRIVLLFAFNELSRKRQTVNCIKMFRLQITDLSLGNGRL